MRLVIKTRSVNHKTQNEPNEDELRNGKFCDISGVHRRFTVAVGQLPWRINMANGNLYLRMPFVRRFAYKTQQIHKTNFDCLFRQQTTYLRSTSIRPKRTRKLRVAGEGMLIDTQGFSARINVDKNSFVHSPTDWSSSSQRQKPTHPESGHANVSMRPINEFSVSYATIMCHLGSFVSFPFHLYTCTIFLPANVEITNNFYQLFAEMRQPTVEQGISRSG